MMDKQTGPLARFWVVASRTAVIALVAVAGSSAALMDTGFGNPAEFVIGASIGVVAVTAGLLLARVVVRLVRPVPINALSIFVAVILALAFLGANSPALVLRTVLEPGEWEWPFGLPHGFETPSLIIVIAAVATLAGGAALLRSGLPRGVGFWPRASFLTVTLVLVLTSGAIVASLVNDGENPFANDYRLTAGTLPPPNSAPDPSQTGAYTVERLSYGFGENRRRPEFGGDRDFESRSVDASPFLADWKGVKKRMREWYWGFGLDDAPLNALVWAPGGDGPFPLVLIVHGNHGMEEYSDPGYAYLGELLASRGFIAVSVDENYINGSWSGDFRGKEMPLRAWLLLEHLAQWRDWNESSGHPFSGRVDMDNIALVGHSRGGEAVPIAYLYNGLTHYPDDATLSFDYGFNIKSLVAIAQVDQRYHRRVEIDDVNFLALQGSYDSDEPAFHGLRQFNRISLSDDAYRFKAGVYVHGANHGQFNSIWGREDLSPPGAWLLNLTPIISADDQRQIAKVYITAFLEATLKDERRYLPLFRDPRTAAGWLPDHAYVNQFTDSGFVPIADFDEDLDVTTGTADGVSIHASGFSLWREEELKHRDERLQGTSAVVLGWDSQSPVYEIELPESFWAGANADVLSLSVSGSTETAPVDGDENGAEEDDEADEPAAPSFRIEAEDTGGRVVSVEAADFAHLAPPLRVQYLKSERLNNERYNAEWEPVLQHIEVPLRQLLSDDDDDATGIRYLRLRFGQTGPGVVLLDDIGVRRPDIDGTE